MEYTSIRELPEGIKDSLPKEAQAVYIDSYNKFLNNFNASEQGDEYGSLHSEAHRFAWSVVKRKYEQTDGSWHRKE